MLHARCPRLLDNINLCSDLSKECVEVLIKYIYLDLNGNQINADLEAMPIRSLFELWRIAIELVSYSSNYFERKFISNQILSFFNLFFINLIEITSIRINNSIIFKK